MSFWVLTAAHREKEIHPNYAIHSTLMAGRCPMESGDKCMGYLQLSSMTQMQLDELAKYNEAESISVALGREGLADKSINADKEEARNPILMAQNDVHTTQYLDDMYEWTSCLPQHRFASGNDSICELGNDRFSVHFQESLASSFFSRVQPTAASYEDWRLDSNNGKNHGSRKDAANAASGPYRCQVVIPTEGVKPLQKCDAKVSVARALPRTRLSPQT